VDTRAARTLRVREHGAQQVVDQRLLQVDVALRHARHDLAADEVVVHHLVQPVGCGVDCASGT
jgi:hypothetical protein